MKLNEALQQKNQKRTEAMEAADLRRAELHARLPRVRQIDLMLQDIPMRTLVGESVEELRAESERLSAERARILAAAGYDPDHDTPEFGCRDCNDGGYIGLKLCHCVKELMAQENYRASVLAGGLSAKSFDNFSLSYYAEGEEREKMQKLLDACVKYTEKFPANGKSGLLFIGGTGLGKTHLSAAVANLVAQKGYSVVYESAQQIFDTIDAVRFNRLELSERKKYETCALLVIDDLGAEYITQYSISAITGLIDLRIVNRKQTIISSNLSPAALSKTYGERLCSRLIGEFSVCSFRGRDIRMQKIKDGSN